jgi:hypothetical protein
MTPNAQAEARATGTDTQTGKKPTLWPVASSARLCQNPPLQGYPRAGKCPLPCNDSFYRGLLTQMRPTRPSEVAQLSPGRPGAAASRRGSTPAGGCTPIPSTSTPSVPSPTRASEHNRDPTPASLSRRGAPPMPSVASSPPVDSAHVAPSPPTGAHRPRALSASRLSCACTAT